MKGRKRHVLVDTLGLILHVLVHEAGLLDHEGGKHLLKPLGGCFPRLKLIWVDSAYKKGDFIEWEKRDVRLGSGGGGASLEWPAWRLGAKGHGHRLGEDPPQWLPRAQMALDCRENLRLALHVASARQGLRSTPEQ